MVEPALKPVVLITGAARRIGRALARDFAERGWRVAIHCQHSRAEADDLARTLLEAGTEALVLEANLRNDADVASLMARCIEGLGAPVCLINNAAEFLFDDIATLAPDIWEAHLATNLKAPIFLARALLKGLPEGKEGNVINIIDQRVLDPTPNFFSYTISKSALWTATRMLAQAMAPRVRVNAIGPGPVLPSVHQTEAEFAAERTRTPLHRGTSPQEIAAAIRFILDAPAMTGQMIVLDGGQHLGPLG
jgi:NAD(P)-dependent dehydrogenase (short-subunit alcohol dehydrogenase family)